MALSDVPHKPRPRAFAPPGHGLAVFPRSLALACSAVLRPRVPLSRYFVAAAHQSNPAPALGRDGGYCWRSHSTAALSMRPRQAPIDSAVSLVPVPEWHALWIGHLLHVLRWGGGV